MLGAGGFVGFYDGGEDRRGTGYDAVVELFGRRCECGGGGGDGGEGMLELGEGCVAEGVGAGEEGGGEVGAYVGEGGCEEGWEEGGGGGEEGNGLEVGEEVGGVGVFAVFGTGGGGRGGFGMGGHGVVHCEEWFMKRGGGEEVGFCVCVPVVSMT